MVETHKHIVNQSLTVYVPTYNTTTGEFDATLYTERTVKIF
jgi:hypothetical protein